MLIEAAEKWAVSCGYSEITSNTETENTHSIDAHLALKFTKIERSVSFLKKINQGTAD